MCAERDLKGERYDRDRKGAVGSVIELELREH